MKEAAVFLYVVVGLFTMIGREERISIECDSVMGIHQQLATLALWPVVLPLAATLPPERAVLCGSFKATRP